MTDLDLARAVQKQARAKSRRKQQQKVEEAGPKLPRHCKCERPIPIPAEDGLGPRCFRCAKWLAA